MLKIEVIKFDALDVITASVATPPVQSGPVETPAQCTNPNGHTLSVIVENGALVYRCTDCGATGASSDSIVGG